MRYDWSFISRIRLKGKAVEFLSFSPQTPSGGLLLERTGRAGQAGGAAAQMWIPDGLQAGPRRLMQAVSVSEELEDVFVLLCVPIPATAPNHTNTRMLPASPARRHVRAA